MKTLVIVSHPYFERSAVTKALQAAAERMPDVTVRNLEALYGNAVTSFDVSAEQKAVEAADRIVFLFPIHWFNLTPMLKAYLNEVWAYGWAFGPGGTALKGKEMLVHHAGRRNRAHLFACGGQSDREHYRRRADADEGERALCRHDLPRPRPRSTAPWASARTRSPTFRTRLIEALQTPLAA